jgi:glycosyltransferase involved in cell wall biosynthesis
MKVIALLPVKNEAWILPAFLSSVKQIADEIIVLDDHSEDNSREILLNANVQVETFHSNSGERHSMSDLRNKLLELGRESGGTHFIWLDADEAFTANFLKSGRSVLESLRPGQKLSMQWLALWKTIDKFRDDQSVWSNNFKDFIVCDHPDYGFEDRFLSEGRTQGPNTSETLVKLPLEKGAVLHFQFVPWQKFQLKQAWYRCLELINAPTSAETINATYAITLDDPEVSLQQIPHGWTEGLKIDPKIIQSPADWHLNEIIILFNKHGIEFFEPLQIWHIKELRMEFENKLGRLPISQIYKPGVLSRIKGKLGRVIKGHKGA